MLQVQEKLFMHITGK